MSDKIKISLRGDSHEFPLVKGTENELGIDIKDLRSRTGLITLDPGFKNTGSCFSDITYLDGEKGILRNVGKRISANTRRFRMTGKRRLARTPAEITRAR